MAFGGVLLQRQLLDMEIFRHQQFPEVLMLVGIGLIGSLTSTITAVFFQKTTDEEKSATKDILISSIQSQLNNFDKLSDDDIQAICKTLQCLHEGKGDNDESRNENSELKEEC